VRLSGKTRQAPSFSWRLFMNTLYRVLFIFCAAFYATTTTAREAINIKITDQQVRQIFLDQGLDIRTRWNNIFYDKDFSNQEDLQRIESDFNQLITEIAGISTRTFDQESSVSLEELAQAIGIKDASNSTVAMRRQSVENCSYCKNKSVRGMRAPKALHYYTIQKNADQSCNPEDFFKVICLITQYHLEFALYKNMSHDWQHAVAQLPRLGILVSTCIDQPIFISGNLPEENNVPISDDEYAQKPLYGDDDSTTHLEQGTPEPSCFSLPWQALVSFFTR
jgi:hypothetical protein